MALKHQIRRLFRKFGFDILRFSPDAHPLARRKALIKTFGIDLIFDVGAHTGQFARSMRQDLGYRGRIISFEPMQASFQELQKNAHADDLWETQHCALGDTVKQEVLHISHTTDCSSLLAVLPTHTQAAPQSKVIGTETISLKTLDSLLPTFNTQDAHIYLKIDTQGFEGRVLDGAQNALKQIDTIQLEMSLVPLYEEGLLFKEMYLRLLDAGYELISLEPGFADPESGRLLQTDGIFHRSPTR